MLHDCVFEKQLIVDNCQFKGRKVDKRKPPGGGSRNHFRHLTKMVLVE